MGLINVIHPSLPPAQSSLQDETAFKEILEGKGWVKISPEDALKHNQAVEAGEKSPILEKISKPAKSEGGK